MAKKEKKIGFKPIEQQICDTVKEQVDAELKKVRGLVRSEVKAAVKEAFSAISGRLDTVEQRMIASFGKMQGEIEMLSKMEQHEDMDIMTRLQRLEMQLLAQQKILETHAQAIDELVKGLKNIMDKFGSAPSSKG